MAKTEDSITVSEFSKDAWYRYALETIENRALAEIYDGMKPVGRRILFGMSRMGLVASADPTKTARVVGEVIGKLHPHGDTSISDAITTLVNAAIPPIKGVGNWGDRENGPAAPRYTNCKLTKYGMTLVDKDYLAVSPMTPNYDGKDMEPVVLPALLPNLFLNGGSGIAVGVTIDLPPIEPRGLLAAVRAILAGEEVTPKKIASTTRVVYANGAYQVLADKGDRAAWVQFWETGKSTLKIQPKPYILDSKTATMIISGLPPSLGAISKFIESCLLDERVKDVRNLGIHPKYGMDTIEIQLKPSRQLQSVAQEVFGWCIANIHPKLNAVQRRHVSVENVEDIQTRIRTDSPLEVLKSWCALRVKLEDRYLAYKADRVKSDIAHTTLMIKACLNREVILKALNSKTPEQVLVKSLKISEEQAAKILDMPIRRLSVLDETKLKETLKKHEATLKEIATWQKKPAAKIIADLKAIEAELNL